MWGQGRSGTTLLKCAVTAQLALSGHPKQSYALCMFSMQVASQPTWRKCPGPQSESDHRNMALRPITTLLRQRCDWLTGRLGVVPVRQSEGGLRKRGSGKKVHFNFIFLTHVLPLLPHPPAASSHPSYLRSVLAATAYDVSITQARLGQCCTCAWLRTDVCLSL